MKKNLFRSGFNLIEVTMAIAIVGIGIAGVMALFPPAIEANKNANFQNYTGTIVNNVAAYLNYKLRIEEDSDGNKKWASFKESLPASKNVAPKPPTETNTDGWNEVTELPGIFTTPTSGILGIKSYDGSIAAHVRVWRDDGNRNPGYFNKVAIPMNNDFRTRVVIELSWPITKAYDDGQATPTVLRETQEFVYEFNKPE